MGRGRPGDGGSRRGIHGYGKLAGAPGFEPGDGGTKNRCLTTWLRPNASQRPYNSVFEKHNRAEGITTGPASTPSFSGLSRESTVVDVMEPRYGPEWCLSQLAREPQQILGTSPRMTERWARG